MMVSLRGSFSIDVERTVERNLFTVKVVFSPHKVSQVSMEQPIVKLSSRGGIEKQDTSLKYQTYGDEGAATCIVELSDHNPNEEPNTIRSKVIVIFSMI